MLWYAMENTSIQPAQDTGDAEMHAQPKNFEEATSSEFDSSLIRQSHGTAALMPHMPALL